MRIAVLFAARSAPMAWRQRENFLATGRPADDDGRKTNARKAGR